MNIIEKIKESVESSTKLPFYYDSPETLNTRLDNVELPCAMMELIEQGAVTDDNGIIRERLTIQVLFTDLCDLDIDGITAENIIDRLKRKSFLWLCDLRKSYELKLVQTLGTARYYASNDAIVCAYGVTIQVEEVEGISSCSVIE